MSHLFYLARKSFDAPSVHRGYPTDASGLLSSTLLLHLFCSAKRVSRSSPKPAAHASQPLCWCIALRAVSVRSARAP